MSVTWFAFCITALVAIAEGVSHDPLADLGAYPEFQRGLRRYRLHHQRSHHHLRGRRPHKMALTHHYSFSMPGPKLDWNPDSDGSPVHAKPASSAMLPGRYKSVEKALGSMGGDLEELKENQLVAKKTRGELEGKVSEVTRHMNDAMSIKHAIGVKEAEIRRERSKLMGLEREAKHVEETHASLVESLHRVLEPKIMNAQHRLERKEMILEKEHQAVKGWKEKQDQIHAHALQLLEDKKVAKQGFEQAEHEIAEAKKRAEVMESKYKEARQLTGQEIQSYRYAETRVKAEFTHEKAAEEAAEAARESVKKLGNVLQVESQKVEESMDAQKSSIHQRMEKITAAQEGTAQQVINLKQRYHEWQESQRVRAADVVTKAEETATAAEAFADRQKQVLDTAEHKVVKDAQAKSDWADESDFSNANDQGFEEGAPSFSD